MAKIKQQDTPFDITLQESRTILVDLLNRMQHNNLALALNQEVVISEEEGPMIRTCVYVYDEDCRQLEVVNMVEDEFRHDYAIKFDTMPLKMQLARLVVQHALRRPLERILDKTLRELLFEKSMLVEAVDGINTFHEETKPHMNVGDEM